MAVALLHEECHEVVMQVYGYTRVSTQEQASNGASLDTQHRQIEDYCLIKGWQLSEVYADDGVSGSVPLAERGRAIARPHLRKW
jgi:DNA invertase Pin-like site-specific DNA recombinase